MEIYTPSAAEAAKWRAGGEKVWDGEGAGIDKAVIAEAVSLRSA
jgi:hypothetical protein